MKKIITILVMAVAMMMSLSCKKTETVTFAFATNPYVRAAEISGNIQTFAFVSPNDWTITWTPVEWITIDESQFSGKASKTNKEYHTIVMNIDQLRENEDRTVEFTVTEGGNKHVMVITQAAPALPEELLEFGPGTYSYKGGSYSFTVPNKYAITVEADSDWITLGEIDYEKNIVNFTLDEIPDGGESRSGAINVYLSDNYLLGTAVINQKVDIE